MLDVLRRRNFALVWLGGLASLTGDWAMFAGLPLAVYQMTGSTLALGVTAIANAIHDACGIRIRELPFYPQRILKLLRERGRRGEERVAS